MASSAGRAFARGNRLGDAITPVYCRQAIIAFIFSLWALYGSGREAVFWDFLVLISGIPLYTWRKWRNKAAMAKLNA
ncbi:MAG: hypothetical protein E6Q98_13345 [Rhodospirillaceae bacterium]|nr:MAG: hypothetical protein E6Q98_13345 [Rhodospirillaceae bacterium]